MKDNLNNAQTAESAGYSEYYFLRIFCECVGLTPADYIRKCRIINTPRRKIGKKKTVAIRTLAEETGRSMYDSLKKLYDTDLFRGCKAKE